MCDSLIESLCLNFNDYNDCDHNYFKFIFSDIYIKLLLLLNFDYLFTTVCAFVIILMYNRLFTVRILCNYRYLKYIYILTKNMLIKLISHFVHFICEIFKYIKYKNNV